MGHISHRQTRKPQMCYRKFWKISHTSQWSRLGMNNIVAVKVSIKFLFPTTFLHPSNRWTAFPHTIFPLKAPPPNTIPKITIPTSQDNLLTNDQLLWPTRNRTRFIIRWNLNSRKRRTLWRCQRSLTAKDSKFWNPFGMK